MNRNNLVKLIAVIRGTTWMDLLDADTRAVIADDPQIFDGFNMRYLDATVQDHYGNILRHAECHCVKGWADRLGLSLAIEYFDDTRTWGWCFSAMWANIKGAETPQAATHRLTYLLDHGSPPRTFKYPLPFDWAAFVEANPLDQILERVT